MLVNQLGIITLKGATNINRYCVSEPLFGINRDFLMRFIKPQALMDLLEKSKLSLPLSLV